MTFRPLQDRVVVRRVDPEQKTAGGIFILDTAQEKPTEGEVVAVGPGVRDEEGKVHPLDVKSGDFGSTTDRMMARRRCPAAAWWYGFLSLQAAPWTGHRLLLTRTLPAFEHKPLISFAVQGVGLSTRSV